MLVINDSRAWFVQHQQRTPFQGKCMVAAVLHVLVHTIPKIHRSAKSDPAANVFFSSIFPPCKIETRLFKIPWSSRLSAVLMIPEYLEYRLLEIPSVPGYLQTLCSTGQTAHELSKKTIKDDFQTRCAKNTEHMTAGSEKVKS